MSLNPSVLRILLAGLIVGVAVTIVLFVLVTVLAGSSGTFTLGTPSFYFWRTSRSFGADGTSEVTVRPGLALGLTWLAVAGLTVSAIWRRDLSRADG